MDARGRYRYFNFDMRFVITAGGSLILSAVGTTGAPLQLLGSVARSSIPTIDGDAQWNSNATGPPGGIAFLTIASTDAPIVACAACTLLTVGVFSPQSTSFLISASSDVGALQLLSMGAPSTPVTQNYRYSKQVGGCDLSVIFCIAPGGCTRLGVDRHGLI